MANDALAICFADATLASAFVARWCAMQRVEIVDGVYQVREDERRKGSMRPYTGHLERPPFPSQRFKGAEARMNGRDRGHFVSRIGLGIPALALMATLPVDAEMFGSGFQPCGGKTSTLAIVECVQAKPRYRISG